MESYKKIQSIESQSRVVELNQQTTKLLEQAQKLVIPSIKFGPLSNFDDSFLQISKYLKTILLSLQSIIKSQKPKKDYDFSLILPNRTTLVILFQPRNAEQNILIQCALTRVIFDQFAILRNNFLSTPETPLSFFEKCNSIANSTPNDLHFNPDYISTNLAKVQLRIIVQLKPNLQQAVNYINDTQYMLNPMDIGYKIYLAMEIIKEFVSEVATPEKVNLMASDDYITFLYSLIAINPPENAIAISTFLTQVQTYPTHETLKYDGLLFSSAIQYINENYQIPA